MGLQICDHTHNTLFYTSYSHFHVIRKCLIQATINYLQSLDHLNSNYQDLIHTLNQWITPSKINMINYDYISSHGLPEKLCKINLSGLYYLVNCSDCDGIWSYGQCIEIKILIDTVFDYLCNDEYTDHTVVDDDEGDINDYESLNNVFETAINNRGYVIKL